MAVVAVVVVGGVPEGAAVAAKARTPGLTITCCVVTSPSNVVRAALTVVRVREIEAAVPRALRAQDSVCRATRYIVVLVHVYEVGRLEAERPFPSLALIQKN